MPAGANTPPYRDETAIGWGTRICGGSERGEGGLLGGEEFADAFFGVVEHFVELGAGVGVLFGGGLGFDEAAVGEHDDVHVDGGAGVFFVAEVEEGVAVDDADGGGGDHLFERRGLEGAGVRPVC